MKTTRTWLLALAFGLAPVSAYSGSFDVNPIRLWIGSETEVRSLSIRNSGSQPILVQAELMRWKDEAKLTPSRDLLVNPPIFTLSPNQTQIVRIAIDPGSKQSHSLFKEREIAYRLYLREIAKPMERGDPLLQTALRVGIPIFISPEIKRREVRWEAQESPSGELQVKAINTGTVHVRLTRLEIQETPEKPALQRDLREYLFPGKSKTWSFRRASRARITLLAQTDEGTLSAELAVKKK